jgi:hypothetical protein
MTRNQSSTAHSLGGGHAIQQKVCVVVDTATKLKEFNLTLHTLIEAAEQKLLLFNYAILIHLDVPVQSILAPEEVKAKTPVCFLQVSSLGVHNQDSVII